MKLPERHQSYIKNKMRSYYLLPVVYYPRSRKLCFRWPLRNVQGTCWSHYLWVNIKTFLCLPYLVYHNWRYFGRTGFVYWETDYDALYGE